MSAGSRVSQQTNLFILQSNTNSSYSPLSRHYHTSGALCTIYSSTKPYHSKTGSISIHTV